MVANERSSLNTRFHAKIPRVYRSGIPEYPKNEFWNFTYGMEVPPCLGKMGVAATPVDRSGRAVRLWNPETMSVNPYSHVRVATVNRLAVIVKKRVKTQCAKILHI